MLHTRPLLWRTTITLHGDFSFDAVSPDGSSLYLIQYTSALDPTKYNVRVYDLDSSRLVKAPIVDPHERGEKMRGQPLTRATSSDGRWAYTLYDGAGKAPFVHALDTSNRIARCIDLDALAKTDLTRLGLRLDTRRGLLIVTRGARPALNVDLASFQVRPPSTGTSGFPWLLASMSLSLRYLSNATLSSLIVLLIAATRPFAVRMSARSVSTSAPRSALLRFRTFVASSSTVLSCAICVSSVFLLRVDAALQRRDVARGAPRLRSWSSPRSSRRSAASRSDGARAS